VFDGEPELPDWDGVKPTKKKSERRDESQDAPLNKKRSQNIEGINGPVLSYIMGGKGWRAKSGDLELSKQSETSSPEQSA